MEPDRHPLNRVATSTRRQDLVGAVVLILMYVAGAFGFDVTAEETALGGFVTVVLLFLGYVLRRTGVADAIRRAEAYTTPLSDPRDYGMRRLVTAPSDLPRQYRSDT